MGKLPRAVKMIASDELIGESLPKRPIIELCSDHRLYVERHLGVYEYSDVEIHIGVNFGRIIIRGGCLQFRLYFLQSVSFCLRKRRRNFLRQFGLPEGSI